MSFLRPHILFDRLEEALEGAVFRRLVSVALVVVFVGTLAAVELKRQALLSDSLASFIPGSSHFISIDLCFGLLLIYEGIGLILGLARSVSEAVGKQIEVFSLILLRRSFKEFAHFGEPLQWGDEAAATVVNMLADAGGALVIFALLAVYYRAQKHQGYLVGSHARSEYIEYKKAIALLLFAAWLAVGVVNTYLWVHEKKDRLVPFFEGFYTMLIFVDILLVLVSLQFSATYHVAFRASGFTVATVLLRIALVASPLVSAALGVGATLYALALTQSYNFYFRVGEHPSVVPPLDTRAAVADHARAEDAFSAVGLDAKSAV